MRLAFVFAFAFLPLFTFAQTPTPAPASSNSRSTTAALQASVDRLTESNRDLLDLLKKQQAVLEDIQFDRRLQSRQIESLEERLQETLIENDKLQNKIDQLSSAPPAAAPAAAPTSAPPDGLANAPPPSPATSAAPTTPVAPAPPASYLPAAPDANGAPGVQSWHRLFALAGNDSRSTDLFQIQGHQWRVVWHNQDKDGKAYKNTSALFLNAFPKDDTIPQKVCAKLGSGGDSTELAGPGNYYLKIEASGGSWELAVEDFH